MNIQSLLDEKEKHYGNAHELTGMVMGALTDPFLAMLNTAPMFSHNWVLMLSKLIRMLSDPYHLDNYDDIIGYATLCKQMAERLKGE